MPWHDFAPPSGSSPAGEGFASLSRSALHLAREISEPSIRSDGSDLPSVGPPLSITLRLMGRGSASDRPRTCGPCSAARLAGPLIDSARRRMGQPKFGPALEDLG
uniref:Uncharacterized protein n=1 Tax=Oryza meridionalis TaxID=40149 RepID=A0A0E0DKG4_9ORYZ